MTNGVAEREAAPLRKGDQYHHPDLREAMILVAQDLLESDGPGSWTVRAAARIAGVSSGAPYRHFADKDALIAAVAARGFEELGRDIEAKLATAGDDAAARLRAVADAYIGFAHTRPGRYQVMFGRDLLDRNTQPELGAAADRTFEVLVREVRTAQEAGYLRADQTAERLASSAWAMAHGVSDLMLSGRLRESGAEPHVGALQLGWLLIDGLRNRA
jgi:AcrR family transcriptional regulator